MIKLKTHINKITNKWWTNPDYNFNENLDFTSSYLTSY